MSKIVITGATGFIGSHLVRFFINNGHDIIAQGSSKSTIKNLISNLEIDEINIKKVEFWQQDFLKEDWNFPDFSHIDFIIHCAAATKVREGTIENYEKYFGLNVLATKILAKKALDEKISHFIHLSTGQVFGIPSHFPITENTPKNPINLYGYTKLIGEKIVASLGILGLKYTIARPFSIYGKGHYNIISIITDKIINNEVLIVYGDGEQSRAFLHVKDICRAIGLILNNETCFSEEYNLSGLKEYSVNDLIKLISDKFKKMPKIIFKESGVNELKRNIADLTKIENLGFRPQENLEDFIAKIN
ncbi:MAG: NAD(P)-dependent oxidoreductase [Promethearchaeota archaeon]|nr:MAG: NAD(P)-dependent oxidoreductase [Candidatus Lokiarchaeota archaeon]